MSQTETMEKEFTETELAGGESLVEDEDLTDEEYVEALGEHNEDGSESISDKSKKVKSPLSSPLHQQKKDADKSAKNLKKIGDPINEKQEDQVSVSASSAAAATDNDDKEKEAIDKAKDCIGSNQHDDSSETEVNYGDVDEDDEGKEEDGEKEEDEEDEGHDEESIEDGHEDAEDQENTEVSKLSNKELDDDEDRRNPQYIPKRGAFYEHDDRLGTDEEEDEEKEPEKIEASSVEKKLDNPVVEARKAKKLWSDDAKWGHDMFDDEEQRPKPRDEIVSTYGYDIRNEDGPPKARRRRRYGRGPNRYTRSWKDEGAYSKPNETPIREKVKPDNENIKREKDPNRPFINKDTNEKLTDSNNRKSGPKGQQQRRTEVKSIASESNDRNDRIDRKKTQQREREGRDLGGQHRDNERYQDRRRNGSINRSPGPSKDLREFINNKNERLSERGEDGRRNQKDFFENDFPELPQKSKDKIMRPQQHQQSHQLQTTTVGNSSQPNAWSKSRPKHADTRETIRGIESSIDYKKELMRVAESNDNGKHRSFNLSETNPKIEIVKTQTFENSRYFNRRPLTKGGGHHQEPPNNIKKDLSIQRNNRGRTRQAAERDFRNSSEVGRPITKTSHLADDYEESGGSGNNTEQQRRNRYNVNKERDFRSNHHGSDDRARRGSEVDSRGRSYLHDDRHYENQFNDNQTDLSGGLNKLTLVEKSNNRLPSSEVNDSNNLAKPKRYSSLRQHQAQQQQQQSQSEPLSQHKQAQSTPSQQPQQSARDAHQANSNLPQYPSTSQHLNLNHPRQSTNVQYYEAAAGSNSQPPPPSASYYIDNRSPQSTFGYIPTTNIEGGPNATRFLPQIAPRFIPPPTAPPPTAPEPRFMAQAVAAANPAAGPLPPVIPGPPAATYLSTYPPGYPQYPPPPAPTAAQFSIAPPPPPPPPTAPEMYRGGVTYYDTMTQQVSPRQLPQRRPKNALPIVPPPDLSNNPDGMVINANQGYEVDENDLNQNVETIPC